MLRSFVVSALAAAALAALPASGLAAAPDDALATAHYGSAEVWLQRKPGSKERELVLQRTPSAAPTVVAITVPPRNTHFASEWAENVGLGTDTHGRLTAVMQSARGLYWTYVTHVPLLHRVPGTTKDDTYPSLFRGRIAYGRQSGTRSLVRLGSLVTPARTVWSNASNDAWAAAETAIGSGDAIAFATVRDGAGNGGSAIQLVHPDGGTKRLAILGLGDTHEGGLGIAGLSTNGRRLTVDRELDSASTTLVFALPSGRKL